MKISDVVSQIAGVLPKYTGYFSDEISANLTFEKNSSSPGGVVTAITSGPHGIKNNSFVTITDATFSTFIDSISIIGSAASLTTENNHDLTLGYQKTVNLSGADQQEFNGEHELIGVTNRKSLQFKPNQPLPPITGNLILNEDRLGYNGRHQVEVLGSTAFRYQIPQEPSLPSSCMVKSNIRISGGINFDRVTESYTRQESNKLYCFVIPQPSLVSRNRSVTNDAIDDITPGSSKQIREIESFTVYIFIPSSDISGRSAYDLTEEISPLIYRSLVGVKFPSGLSEERTSGVALLGHGLASYHDTLYVHAYEFQTSRNITFDDMANLDESVAFRDIEIDTLNDFDETILSSKIDLDEIPLQ